MIPSQTPACFALIPPRGREVPIVVEVPHAGTLIPDEYGAAVDVCAQEVLRDADTFVDTLWRDAANHGVTSLVSQVSRYVVDLNREQDDVDARTVEGARANPPQPRGVVWRETGSGRCVLPTPLDRDDFSARIARYYRPYHDSLEATLRALHQRHGRVLLVAAHSMPSRSRLGVSARRAAVVPGTLGRSSAASALIDLVDAHFRAAGLSVRHDQPYRGGATTARWGRPTEGFHAIQIELNRSLYMDEDKLTLLDERAAWLRGVCGSLLPRLAATLDDRSMSAI